jgi:L-ascorbate metabolism protein UlaG (beta-lactamase superfamily)
MKIKWYGHAAFRIKTDGGVRIIIDPYESGAFGGALSYGSIRDEADLVLTSHEHADHNYTKDIRGQFIRIDKEGEYDVKGVKVRAMASFHDPSKGAERGNNLIFLIEVAGLIVAHAGDLGHALDKETLAAIGKVDVLLIPVGGFYTIDAKVATNTIKSLNPSITIPMHYKTEKCDFPIAPLADFTKGKTGLRPARSSEVEISKAGLPKTPEILVLDYAM